MAEIGISIAAKVAELQVDPIGRQISYAFKYQRNMEELKKQVQKLTNQRESVQHSVDEAKRQGEEIEKQVQEWLNKVDEFVNNVVKPIIDDQVKVKKLCSIGFCPNLMKRYPLSKKAVKAAKDGVDLLEEGKFQKVSYRLPPRRINSLNIKGYEDFVSRMSLSKSIMEALADADANLIGVYGMGGVGKTTLVKKVAQQAKENKLFDLVVTALVTETPDIRKIQGQIADELGLKFQEESLPGRAARLRERMKKENSILVILDNVWAKLDLESIGIPVGGDEKGSITQKVHQKEGDNANKKQCKILLTSRRLDVLRDDMDTQKNFKVEILSDTEGESLFWTTVGCLEEKSDLNSIAVEIVGKCGGLPVAIKTIANALKNKSLPSWKTARDQLKKANPKSIKGMNADVYSTIELSFDYLEGEEAKSLFLFCSLLNSGYGIYITDILKYTMGLGLFQDVDTIEEGRNKLHSLIDDLKTSCLLMDHDNDSDYVKMHDVIHVVAVSIASTTKLWFNLQDDAAGLKEELEKKLPKDSAAVTLIFRDIYELPEKIEFPKLELFLLYMEHASLQIPDTVFEGVKSLKVLDMSGIHLLSPPSSLRCLINLHTLCLDRCRLEDVAIIGELKELEVLSFLKSDIEQLPAEIGQLTRLRLLDLSYCPKLKAIKPNVISSLTRLEELYMGDSFDQWDIEGQSNASIAELKQLTCLTALDIHIPNAQIIPQDLSFGKLERYRIFIGEGVWDWSGKCETSKTLKLKLSSSIYLSNEIKSLLIKTEDVHLDKLKGVKSVVYELSGEGFPQLKHLHVQNGSDIQYIANSFGWGLCNVFPRLESLFLDNLINLEKICHAQLATNSFSKLRIMKVGKCDRLKRLFSFSMVKNLLQLQEIEVTNCKKLEEIISKENMELVHQNESIRRIEFTQLHTLTLECLPQLTSFRLNASTPDIGSQEIVAEDEADGFMSLFSQNVVLPSLKNLKLSSIIIRCTWLDQLPVISSCCQALTDLTLEECNDLMFLFSYSAVKSLLQLQNLKIRNCKSIEGIINTEELRGEEKMIMMVFPKLRNLQLKGLPKLVRFGSGNSIEFLSLTEISIDDCPKLKTFFSGSKYADIKQSKEIEEMICQNDIHPLFDQKVELPTLASLYLSSIASQTLWHNQLQAHSACFHNLTELTIDGCDNLKYLFPFSVAESLDHLEVLDIWNCKLMEGVIITQGERKSSTPFPKLKQLTLYSLPELTRFCNFNGNSIELPSLTELIIENCPKMQTFASDSLPGIEEPVEVNTDTEENLPSFFDEKVLLPNLENLKLSSINIECLWLDQLPAMSSCCQTLTSLTLEECSGNLKFLFSYSMVKSLVLLETLEIRNCKSIERVINSEELRGEGKGIKMVFPKLINLQLKGLPNLTQFASGNTVEFPSLNQLSIMDCQKLKTFSSALTYPDIKQSKAVEEMNCQDDIHPFFDEKVVLPTLASINLSSIRIQTIWHNPLQPMSPCFQHLKEIIMDGCDTVKHGFPSSMVESLVQLEVLKISNCKLMEVVTIVEGERISNTLFTKLHRLHLKHLPELTTFCNFAGKLIELTSLAELWLENCPKMHAFVSNSPRADMPAAKEEQKNSEKNLQYSHIQPFFDEKVRILDLKFLHIEKMDNMRKIWCYQLIMDSFSKIDSFSVYDCHNLLNIFPSNMLGRLQKLRELVILRCNSLEVIFEELNTTEEDVETVPRFVFPQLTYLALTDLPSLRSFYPGLYISEWPKLNKLTMWRCNKVEILTSEYSSFEKSHGGSQPENSIQEQLFIVDKVAFPKIEHLALEWNWIVKEILHRNFSKYSCNLKVVELIRASKQSGICPCCFLCTLTNLERLDVYYGFFEEIFTCEGLDCKEKHAEAPSKLSQLKLDHLADSLHQWEEDSLLCKVFRNLTSLEVLECDNLKNLVPSFVSFQNLKKLEVSRCDGLVNLMEVSVAKSLVQLTRLKISECKMIEEIIMHDVDEVENRMIFDQLEYLELHSLPKLTSFCSWNCNIEFPSLQQIVVRQCPTMEIFSQGVLSTPKLQRLQTAEGDDEGSWEGSLNTTIQKLFKDMIGFRGLQHLTTSEFPHLKEVWYGQFPVEVFCNLKSLVMDDCENISSAISGNLLQHLNSLEKLHVRNGDSIEQVFDLKELNADGDFKVLPQLSEFNLVDLPRLKHIWNKNNQSEVLSFRNLKLMKVDNCSNLRYIFTPSVVLGLMQLQELEIKNCVILEVITVIGEETISNTMFPNLNSLELINLPNLTCFCNFAGNSIELPSLTQLWIENCPNMETFISNFLGVDMSTSKDNCHTDIQPLFDEKVGLPNLEFLRLDKMDKLREIWHHQLSANSFCKLDSFGVYNCHNVMNVFPSNMFGRLQKLEELWLTNCSSLYEIFELQASSCGKTQAITATQLEKLVLRDLPKLKHKWDVDSQGLLTCQNLISIEVTACGSLKSIFPASVGRNLLRLEELLIDNCCMVEEIFAKEELVDEAVPQFPQLTLLRLGQLPRFRSFYPRVHISEWPMLKELQVWNCDKVEVSASNFLSFQVTHEMPLDQPLLLLDKVPFSNLESLRLDWKWFEKEALHEKLPEYSCKLNFLTIEGFHKGADICVFCFLHKLPNLEKLQVSGGFFKGLFLCEGFGCEEKHVEAPSKLSHLRLVELNDSLHLWEENSLSSKGFQNLAILEVVCCSNIKSLVPSYVSFQNLTRLEVLECNKMLNLVAVPTAKSLMQLTELSISECKMVEEIIIHEGDEVKDRIIFKKLRNLELKCLPSLTSFYPGSYTTVFPSLQQVVVSECPNMKIFSRGILSTPRLHRLQTTEEEGKGFWKGNLNTTIEHLFIENGQSSTEN